MKRKTKREDLMVRYLLGDLTGEEQTQIEEQFLNDNEYFEQLLAVEDALVDDYAQGVLNEHERSKVESLLLSSRRQARELDFVKDLIGFVSAQPADELNTRNSTPVERPGKRRSLLALLRAGNSGERFSIAAGLLFIVITLGMFIWNLALRRQVGQMETRQAALENRDQELQGQLDDRDAIAKKLEDERKWREQLEQELAALRESGPVNSSNGVAVVDLKGGSFSRGGGQLRIVRIASGISRLEFRINLGTKGDYKSYGAVIKTFDGSAIWSKDPNHPGQVNFGRLVFTVPAKTFSNNDYIFTLRGQTGAGVIEDIRDYPFGVRK